MKVKLCLVIFIGLYSTISAFGQLNNPGQPPIPANSTKKDSTTAKTEWDVTLDYYTRSVFLGRTDTIGSGYYLPAIAVNLKSGLFFELAPSLFQQNTPKAYGGLTISGGYDKTLSNNFAIDFQLIKNFFPSSANASRRINSTVTFEGEAGVDYINEIVTSELIPQILFNKSSFDNTPDYVFTLTESHPFYIYAALSYKDSLSITPSASVSAGTQNFYFAYFNTKVLADHPKAVIKRTKLASEGKILDYELSVPISYYWGHLVVTATPLYSIGENILGRTTPLDVWSADIGVGYRFW